MLPADFKPVFCQTCVLQHRGSSRGRKITRMARTNSKAEKALCGETVCPKGCFWRVRFFSAPLGLSGLFKKGQRRNGLSKTPCWTTVSPHDTCSAPLARSEFLKGFGQPRARVECWIDRNHESGVGIHCFQKFRKLRKDFRNFRKQ